MRDSGRRPDGDVDDAELPIRRAPSRGVPPTVVTLGPPEGDEEDAPAETVMQELNKGGVLQEFCTLTQGICFIAIGWYTMGCADVLYTRVGKHAWDDSCIRIASTPNLANASCVGVQVDAVAGGSCVALTEWDSRNPGAWKLCLDLATWFSWSTLVGGAAKVVVGGLRCIRTSRAKLRNRAQGAGGAKHTVQRCWGSCSYLSSMVALVCCVWFLWDYEDIAGICANTIDLEGDCGMKNVHKFVLYALVGSVALELLPHLVWRARRTYRAFKGTDTSGAHFVSASMLNLGSAMTSAMARRPGSPADHLPPAAVRSYVHHRYCALGADNDELMVGNCGWLAAVATADGLEGCVGFVVEGDASEDSDPIGFHGRLKVHFISRGALQEEGGRLVFRRNHMSHVFLRREVSEEFLAGEILTNDERDEEELYSRP